MQPPRPDSGTLTRHQCHWFPCCPLPDEQREVDSGPDGVVYGPDESRVYLHQQRLAGGVAPEFDLAQALHADCRTQPDRGVIRVGRCGDALPQHRGTAERRRSAIFHVRAAGQHFPADDEQRHAFTAARHPWLGENGRACREEAHRHFGGLCLVNDLGGNDPGLGLLRPRYGRLEYEGKAELGDRNRQLLDVANAYQLRVRYSQLTGDFKRPVLVKGDRKGGIGGQRQHGAKLRELPPTGYEGRAAYVTGRKENPCRVLADELKDRIHVWQQACRVARQYYGPYAVARAERWKRQGRVVQTETLPQSDAQPSPAEAAGAR